MPTLTITLDDTDYSLELGRDGSIESVRRTGWTHFEDWQFLRNSEQTLIRRHVQIVQHVAPGDGHTYLRGRIMGHDCTGRTVPALLRAYAAGVESIDDTDDPMGMARYASTVLAGDKGIPNHIESHDGRNYDVVTDEGKRFRFCLI